MAGNIGGFFATLTLKHSADDFNKARKGMLDIGEATNKTGVIFKDFIGNAIKGLIGLEGAAVGAGYAVSNIQGKIAINAKAAGLGYQEYLKLSSALKLVGVDASGVADKMGNVNSAIASKFTTNAAPYQELGTKLALLGGMKLPDFEKMTASQRLKWASDYYQSLPERTKKEQEYKKSKYDIINELFGIGGALTSFSLKGSKYSSWEDLMGKSGTWASNESDVVRSSQSYNALSSQMDQMWKEFGEKMGKSFSPIIDDIVGYIDKHKKEITDFFNNVGIILSDLVKALGPAVRQLGSVLGSLAEEAANYTTVADFKKKNPEAAKKIEDALKKKGYKTHSVAENLLSDKAASETAQFAAQEALAIRLIGKSYAEEPTKEARQSFGAEGKSSIKYTGSNNVTVNITGTDFNKAVNYANEHPGVNVLNLVDAILTVSDIK